MLLLSPLTILLPLRVTKECGSFKMFLFKEMGTQMHTVFKSNLTLSLLNAMFSLMRVTSTVVLLKIMQYFKYF